MGIVSRLRGIAWFRRFPTCSCFGQTPQGSPVETRASGHKAHKVVTNFVQVSLTAVQYFAWVQNLLC